MGNHEDKAFNVPLRKGSNWLGPNSIQTITNLPATFTLKNSVTSPQNTDLIGLVYNEMNPSRRDHYNWSEEIDRVDTMRKLYIEFYKGIDPSTKQMRTKILVHYADNDLSPFFLADIDVGQSYNTPDGDRLRIRFDSVNGEDAVVTVSQSSAY
jgi:hypothetical protein